MPVKDPIIDALYADEERKVPYRYQGEDIHRYQCLWKIDQWKSDEIQNLVGEELNTREKLAVMLQKIRGG